MDWPLCTICVQPIKTPDKPHKLHLEWQTEFTGRYSDEVCCDTCYRQLSNEIIKAIHKVKHEQRTGG